MNHKFTDGAYDGGLDFIGSHDHQKAMKKLLSQESSWKETESGQFYLPSEKEANSRVKARTMLNVIFKHGGLLEMVEMAGLRSGRSKLLGHNDQDEYVIFFGKLFTDVSKDWGIDFLLGDRLKIFDSRMLTPNLRLKDRIEADALERGDDLYGTAQQHLDAVISVLGPEGTRSRPNASQRAALRREKEDAEDLRKVQAFTDLEEKEAKEQSEVKSAMVPEVTEEPPVEKEVHKLSSVLPIRMSAGCHGPTSKRRKTTGASGKGYG
jgi:hypothetical protein